MKQLTELLFSRNNWNTDPNPGTSEVEGRGVLQAINFESPKLSMEIKWQILVDVSSSVPDPWHFCVAPDPDPRIHASD